MSLVELMIVVAIIGMLIQLTLPAIEASREAARRTACQNNLHQIGVAMLNHDSSLQHLPTAGWGWAWMGDPDRGPGKTQPGSWAYQLLPFMDRRDVYEIGQGLSGLAKHQALAKLAAAPVSLFYCPSRRPARPTKNVGPQALVEGFESEELFWFNATRPTVLARTDYAANVGDRFIYWNEGPIPTDAEKGEGFFKFHTPAGEDPLTLDDFTGVVIQRQPFTMAHIVDGTTYTYFAGEKSLPIDVYGTGTNLNDDQSCWNGDDLDLVAATRAVPLRDYLIAERPEGVGVPFGAAHPDGFNMLLCDGSVQFVLYDVDPEVHRSFGNRRDSRTGPAADAN
jgi:prepilin-type processing-associated H-X9-DG protein